MKLKKLILSIIILGLGVNPSFSQQNKFGKKPAYQTEQEKAMHNTSKQQDFFKASQYKAFPQGIILPGEFEESKAVAISWSFDYDGQGIPSGVDLTSPYADISAQLAQAIQKECTVYIRVLNNGDTTLVKNNMISRGTPLFNYRFLVSAGDDWWTRDYGPMAFYSKGLDSIGFADMKYYDGRDKDNLFPGQLATTMGYQNYVTQLNGEGGNFMGDGYGRLFFSDVVTKANASAHATSWSTNQTLDTVRNIFGTPDLSNLPALKCDGGTGHIDLYIKLKDEQTIIASQYPSVITAQDKKIIEDNVQYLSSLKSTYNRPYRIFRVEHPTDDNGTHTRLTCAQIDADARNFINGTTVNNSFIFPSYYDGSTGNAAQHQRIMAFYKRIFPGYKIVPIDSRIMSPLGGAIHCITMQIPVDNPLRIWHPSVDGLVLPQSKYHILVKAMNKSGIQSAICKWRKNANANWTTLNLTDSSGYWVGDISNANMVGSDSVEYFVKVIANNGKTASKPITADSGGYYTMRVAWVSGVTDLVESKNHLFNAYPNPATNLVNIDFKLIHNGSAQIQIMDINGKVVFSKDFESLSEGLHQTQIYTTNFAPGMYLYQLVVDQKPVMSKRLIVE